MNGPGKLYLHDHDNSVEYPMLSSVRACVFDAYGTLLDVHSAVARHAAALGPHAANVSVLWRQRQLEYSWTRTLIGRYADFAELTADALDFAMASHGFADCSELRDDLLRAYAALDAYPEVPTALARLRAAGLTTAILSNGAPRMLDDALRASGIADLVDHQFSVDELRVYKPDPRVYHLVCERLGLEAHEIVFQSANAWDVAGAAAFGFQTVWLNRGRQPNEYRFAPATVELSDLSTLPDLLVSHQGNMSFSTPGSMS